LNLTIRINDSSTAIEDPSLSYNNGRTRRSK